MIRVRTLRNGVRVATDSVSGVRSCSLGIHLEVGSRHELPGEYGVTHFIEHMLFKGTGRHTALELGDEIDRLGGNVNAMTSQEGLLLHAQCIDDKAPRALDLLSEMLLESTFDDEEIRRERNVVLEEYKMYEDTPDDLIVDVFNQALWPRSPLGRPILGTPNSINRFSSGRIRRYLTREFDPRDILIVLAGKFDSDACRRVIRKRFGSLPARRSKRAAPAGTNGVKPRLKVIEREAEQVHFCFGTGGPHRAAPDRIAFGMFNIIFGGGMSSRLFKEVREKRGLAYSIQSFAQPFRGSGSFAIAGASGPETAGEVMEICLGELRRVCDEYVTERELSLARDQIIDALLMSFESTSARMSRLTDAVLNFGRPLPIDEIIKHVREVDAAAIRRVVRKYIARKPLAGAFIVPRGYHPEGFPQRVG